MNNDNPNPDTRVSLIARLCDVSDDDSWTEFVQIYQPVVQRFIQRHGLQYADAAEVTQEVLSRVAKSIDSFDANHERSTFRGWLYRITRNQTIDFLRKKKNEQAKNAGQNAGLSQIADPNADLERNHSEEFQAEYEQQLFQWAAEKLKPSFKPVNWEAFWLSTVEGMSIESVAEKLNIECGKVYVARSRIMSRLSKLIQDRLNETSNVDLT